MKIILEKLHITIGRMQAALAEKMNIFGQWLLTSFMATTLVQTQALLALARNLLASHLQNQARLNQAQAEKHLRNNLYLFLQKIPVARQVFFVFKAAFFPKFLPADS